jgi:hypothetical protein
MESSQTRGQKSEQSVSGLVDSVYAGTGIYREKSFSPSSNVSSVGDRARC